MGNLTIDPLFPTHSQSTVDSDDYQPVAFYDSKVFNTIQEAIIPENKTIFFYSYGNRMGIITNNGALEIYDDVAAVSSRTVNNGTFLIISSGTYKGQQDGRQRGGSRRQ